MEPDGIGKSVTPDPLEHHEKRHETPHHKTEDGDLGGLDVDLREADALVVVSNDVDVFVALDGVVADFD